jgi:hypothetical protein
LELSLSPRLVYYDEVIAKIIWDDDGNVVLASAYGQYAAGLLGAGMSSPDEASLVTKLQGYTEGYYQLAIYALIAGLY